MRIERVDDRTVKCYISREELIEYGVGYKDFLARTAQATKVLHEAMARLGYHERRRMPTDLQIIATPDEGVMLVFSEIEVDGDHLQACINELRKLLEHTRKIEAMSDDDVEASEQGELFEETEEPQEQLAPQEKERPQVEQEAPQKDANPPTFTVFAFASMRNVIEYAASLPANLRVDTALYTADGFYYLFMRKGYASYKGFSRACIQAMEFGSLYTADEKYVGYLLEHGECILEKGVLRRLRNL
jgi:negative regulator of genetic competence, sporulation and motility